MIKYRTDLAVEAKDMYVKESKQDIDGIKVYEMEHGDINVTTVKVESEDAANKLGKPVGTYITVDFPVFTSYDGEFMDDLSKIVAESLKEVIKIDETNTALVVGLGNWNVTADSLGPKVSEKIMVTRHLKQVMPEAIDESIVPVCAISPGVLGVTGIETGEMVKSIVDKIKPDLVICVDSLGSRKLERLNRTIQICDTGISPGAGVGNHRMKINEESLGVKVIAIGVPTVVDAATIANDAIDLVLDELISQADTGKAFYEMLKSINKGEKSLIIRETLNPYVGDLIVTPKDVDDTIENLAKIIANGINIAVQPNLTMEDINKFIG